MYDREKKILTFIYNSSLDNLAKNMGLSNEDELNKYIKGMLRKNIDKPNNINENARQSLRLIRILYD